MVLETACKEKMIDLYSHNALQNIRLLICKYNLNRYKSHTAYLELV